MIPLQNRGKRQGDQVVWLLFNHSIEFTEDEFTEIIYSIREKGLFWYLNSERPALKSRISTILATELPEGIFETEVDTEFYLEQCLLGLNDRVN
ncbi:MAG: hypothetical protein H3C43_07425 [Leptonema sp. (in: Bacteria)]|nr:hypothetical protein [Leptonema sp. (in: bacteria)]